MPILDPIAARHTPNPLATMKPQARRVAAAAYRRIPNPDAAQEAAGIALGLPLLLVALFALSAFGVL